MSVDDAPGAPQANITADDIPYNSEGVTVKERFESITTSVSEKFTTLDAIITVNAAAPTDFTTPLYYDSTAVTGGLYAWNGSAYTQIGGLIA